MKHDVFISYARPDAETADAIRQALESRGIRCWIDVRDMTLGTSFGEAITEALRASQIMVMVISSSADRSASVARELAYASRQGIIIIPVRIEDIVPADALLYEIGHRQWFEAWPPPLARYLPKLVDIVEQSLARTGHLSPPRETQSPLSSASRPASRSTPGVRTGIFMLGGFVGITILVMFVFGPTEPSMPEGDWAWVWRGLAGVVPVSMAVVAYLAAAAAKRAIVSRFSRGAETPLSAIPLDLLRISRIDDLAGLRLPAALRDALATVAATLPDDLERIARQAAQIRSLRDPGRRVEAIEAALHLLSAIQSGLVDGSGQLVETLAGIAADWTAIFIAARDAARVELEESREIENPFVFGNPVHAAQGDGLFTGRRDLVLEIERNILRPAQTPTLLLYGQRRMGKTSILNQLPALLGPAFLPVLVDCQAPAMAESAPALLRYLSRCLSGALNTRLGIAHEDAAVRVARGMEPLPIAELRDDPWSVFEDWLDTFQQRMPKDAHLLLCLDEFERLRETIDAGWGARFLDGLRHWLQHRPRFALMFIGSHTFEQLGTAWTDRFLSARRLKVSFLGADDVRQLLTRPTPSFRLNYASGALEAIVAATHGQPFLTQALAFELVQHMNRVRRREATTADVEAAIDGALERSAEYFVDLWRSREPAERELLFDVALDRKGAPDSPVARSLRDYDVLDEQGRFAVPLVERWVVRTQLLPGQVGAAE